MKNLISSIFRRNSKFLNVDREFTITMDVPLPITGITLKEQMRVMATLKELPVGGSFPIRNELTNAVRKIAEVYKPEYKIMIKTMGRTKRVYRVA